MNYWLPSEKDYQQSDYDTLVFTELHVVPELPRVRTPPPVHDNVPIPSLTPLEASSSTSPKDSKTTKITSEATISNITSETTLPVSSVCDNGDGQWGFSVEVNSSGKGWLYDQSTNNLFAMKEKEIGLTFHTKKKLPDAALMRMEVAYSNEHDQLTRGPVKCARHSHLTHFFSTTPECDLRNSCSAVIPVNKLPEYENKYLIIVQFHCQSSCLAKKTKQKSPELKLQFHLQFNDSELGYDKINIRISSCVSRDYIRYTKKSPPLKKRKIDCPAPVAKKAAAISSTGPLSSYPELPDNHVLNISKNATTDSNGYYHFHWTGKSLYVYNLLKVFKLASDLSSQ